MNTPPADQMVMSHNVKVRHAVGYGLDELVVEEVKKWEFIPATYIHKNSRQ